MSATASFPHETSVRVRYGEVDRMNVAYHAHYLVWFEHGRTEYLRSLGGTYRALEEEGTLLVVVESGVRHLGSAGYDDLLRVRTRLAEVRGVRMRFEYEIRREDERLATGFTVLASCDETGRPCRLPAAFRERMLAQVSDGKAAAPAGVQEESA
jgi:acyl-CoA thioester hydrolase